MVTKEDARALLKTIRSDFHCPHWGAAFDMFISLVAFAAPAARALRALSAAAPDGTFAYIFDFSGGLLGPAHAMELPLLFGTYDANPILKWVSGAPNGGERVSADLMNAFGAFAHSGSPSVSGMDWLPYSEAQATTARFGDEPSIHQAGINASLASVIELMEGHTRPFGLNMPVQFDAELAEPRSKL
jgi:carboxylesterase type B